jgi:hypothetical protein
VWSSSMADVGGATARGLSRPPTTAGSSISGRGRVAGSSPCLWGATACAPPGRAARKLRCTRLGRAASKALLLTPDNDDIMVVRQPNEGGGERAHRCRDRRRGQRRARHPGGWRSMSPPLGSRPTPTTRRAGANARRHHHYGHDSSSSIWRVDVQRGAATPRGQCRLRCRRVV